MDIETKRMEKNGKAFKVKIKEDSDVLTYDDVKRAKKIKDKYERVDNGKKI